MSFVKSTREDDDAFPALELPSSHLPAIDPLFDDAGPLSYGFDSIDASIDPVNYNQVSVNTANPFDAFETRPTSSGTDVPSMSSSLTPTPPSTGAIGTPESPDPLEDTPSASTGNSRKGKELEVDNESGRLEVGALAAHCILNPPPDVLSSVYDGANAFNAGATTTTLDATLSQGDYSASAFANIHPALQVDAPAVYGAPQLSTINNVLEGLARQSENGPSQGLLTGYEQTISGAAAGNLQYFQVNQQRAHSCAGVDQDNVGNNHTATRYAGFADPNTVAVAAHQYTASLAQSSDPRWYNNANHGITALRTRDKVQSLRNARTHAAFGGANASFSRAGRYAANMGPQQFQQHTAQSWQESAAVYRYSHLVGPGTGHVQPLPHRIDPQSYGLRAQSNTLGHINQPYVHPSRITPVFPVPAQQNHRLWYQHGQTSANGLGSHSGLQQPRDMMLPSSNFAAQNAPGPFQALQPTREPSSGPQRRQKTITAARLETTMQPEKPPTPEMTCPVPGCNELVPATRCKFGNHLKDAHPSCHATDGDVTKFKCIFLPKTGWTCDKTFQDQGSLGRHWFDKHNPNRETKCPLCKKPLTRVGG
ncbi:hypothetical protein EVG20_g11269 [Dentipellis fragilis]|uniref:C2H2-type domain-containing protein n=1 Tax=Dentipellis fragilis TaxID=205917 RepID=A0A4Y9XNE3_9AGAM|nr:hypothetical protein EVG20_g11269 [Dentipellis fragilis]